MRWWKIKRCARRFWLAWTHPRNLLFSCLAGFVTVFLAFLALEIGLLTWVSIPAVQKLNVSLKPEYWIALVGGFFAAVGWQVSAIVTMRNSVKQHTISTLLQMRMSEVYLVRATRAWAFLMPYYMKHEEAPALHLLKYSAAHDHVIYVLNYYEFLAVGILHGDLDEKVLKQSLRGIFVTFASTARDFIRHERGEVNGIPPPPHARTSSLAIGSLVTSQE